MEKGVPQHAFFVASTFRITISGLISGTFAVEAVMAGREPGVDRKVKFGLD
ncbi:MAG: hypothetical protein ACP5M4_08855 [Acidobacteriaceae bacterium]